MLALGFIRAPRRVRPALLPLLLLGCQGEIDPGGLPPVPTDPHQSQSDETIYFELLEGGTTATTLNAVTGWNPNELLIVNELGQILRWDGSNLEPIALVEDDAGAPVELYDIKIQTLGGEEWVWVAGEAGTILRYTRDALLTGQPPERVATNTRGTFKSLFCYGDEGVVAAGDIGIYRWDSEQFVRDEAIPGTTRIEAIWGSDGEHLVAVGPAEDGDATLLQFDGQSWTRISLGRSEDLHAVWGTDSQSIWAVGQNGWVVHFDGFAWTTEETPTVSHLWQIGGLPWGPIFVAGTNGTVLFSEGQTWNLLPSGSTMNLYGIWASDLSAVYVVGTWATVLRFDNDPTLPSQL